MNKNTARIQVWWRIGRSSVLLSIHLVAGHLLPRTFLLFWPTCVHSLPHSVRAYVSSKGPDVVNSLQQGLLTYDQFFGGKDYDEESVSCVNFAVCICEENDKPEQV